MNEIEYTRFLRHYSRALNELILKFEYFVEDVGQLNVFSITHRLKSYKNALSKSNLLNIPIRDLQDLAGMKIVVATQNEIEVVTRFFTRQEVSKEIEIESDKYVAKKDGYRARHIIFQYKGNYNHSMYPARIEAQLQTIFEHAFNFISRAWVYKTEKSFSVNWEDEFYDLSKKLATINIKANELHSEVINSATKIDSDEPLTPYSYQQIAKSIFNENIPIHDAVDACRFFVDIGYITNKTLKDFFENKIVCKLKDSYKDFYELSHNEFSKSIAQMSMYNFFTSFGVRYSASKEMLENLKRGYNPKE